jgi:hypothetical protein
MPAKLTLLDVIARAIKIHNSFYTYEKCAELEYKGNRTKLIVTCPIDGVFTISVRKHLEGQACLPCGYRRNGLQMLSNTEKFIEDCHRIRPENDDTVDYSGANYVSSQTKVQLRCIPHNHIFGVRPNDYFTRKVIGCPLCHNKTEGILYAFLKVMYADIEIQYKAEWCKKKTFCPFDFYIPSLNLIIELDGPQHFKDISNWLPFKETMKDDIFKMKCANQNGISILRLLQEDVLHNRTDWKKDLVNSIELIKSASTIKNIFLCVNDEYSFHKELLEKKLDVL